jgi:hypothetical protein
MPNNKMLADRLEAVFDFEPPLATATATATATFEFN